MEVIVGEALPVPKRLDVVLGLVGRRCVSAAGFLPRCKTYAMYAFSCLHSNEEKRFYPPLLLTIEGGSSRDSLRYILLFAVRKDAALPAEDLSAPNGYDKSPQQGRYVSPLVFIALLRILRSGMKYSYQ